MRPGDLAVCSNIARISGQNQVHRNVYMCLTKTCSVLFFCWHTVIMLSGYLMDTRQIQRDVFKDGDEEEGYI